MSSQPPSPPTAPLAVLLYDGECGFCQRIVHVLLRHDAAGRLHYAALQSPPAQTFLRTQGLPTQDFDSLVFVPDWNNPTPGAYHLRTEGALAAARVVGGPLRLLAWLQWMPRRWRDAAYRQIARCRYTLFGRHRPGPLPNPEWQERFLGDPP